MSGPCVPPGCSDTGSRILARWAGLQLGAFSVPFDIECSGHPQRVDRLHAGHIIAKIQLRRGFQKAHADTVSARRAWGCAVLSMGVAVATLDDRECPANRTLSVTRS